MCADLSVSVTTPVAAIRKLAETSATDLIAKQPVPGGVMGPVVEQRLGENMVPKQIKQKKSGHVRTVE